MALHSFYVPSSLVESLRRVSAINDRLRQYLIFLSLVRQYGEHSLTFFAPILTCSRLTKKAININAEPFGKKKRSKRPTKKIDSDANKAVLYNHYSWILKPISPSLIFSFGAEMNVKESTPFVVQSIGYGAVLGWSKQKLDSSRSNKSIGKCTHPQETSSKLSKQKISLWWNAHLTSSKRSHVRMFLAV